MDPIHHLSWNETSFLSKLRLIAASRRETREYRRSGDRVAQRDDLSVLSSTYHSVLGTARATLVGAKARMDWIPFSFYFALVWCFTWAPLAAWCYWRSIELSDQVEELYGLNNMTTDQLDVRQSILRAHGRWNDAENCIVAALRHQPLQTHTEGLLQVGLAEIRRREGVWRVVEELAVKAVKNADRAAETEPRQAARIYRHCADLYDSIPGYGPGVGIELRQRAQGLAESAGAKDQLLKI